MNILIEGVGDPAWGTLLPYLRPAAKTLVGVDSHPLAFGLYMVDRGHVVPQPREPEYLGRAVHICRREKVGLVIPSWEPSLLEWAKRKERLARRGVTVLVSPPETVAVCQDKWETYRFFVAHNVPAPRTSLRHEYELIKPRQGEGGSGVFLAEPGGRADMTGCISQEFLEGQEISVDALCDLDGKVVYVVPRERLWVERGQSLIGKVVRDDLVKNYTRRILAAARFVGPVNIQCFRTAGGVFFTEINPRIGGGLSLSLAATENWFEAVSRMLSGEPVRAKRVRYGLMMLRHLTDCVVHERQLLTQGR